MIATADTRVTVNGGHTVIVFNDDGLKVTTSGNVLVEHPSFIETEEEINYDD